MSVKIGNSQWISVKIGISGILDMYVWMMWDKTDKQFHTNIAMCSCNNVWAAEAAQLCASSQLMMTCQAHLSIFNILLYIACVCTRVFTDKLTSLVTVCTWFVYGVTTSKMKYYYIQQPGTSPLSTTFNFSLIYVVNLY